MIAEGWYDSRLRPCWFDGAFLVRADNGRLLTGRRSLRGGSPAHYVGRIAAAPAGGVRSGPPPTHRAIGDPQLDGTIGARRAPVP